MAHSLQSDSMDLLDEKAAGGPPLEVEDMVSVTNRMSTSPLQAIGVIHYFLDDAFAAKHMPDMGQEIKDFQVFKWRLNNWKKLDKKLTSPDFECGGHKWCAFKALRHPHKLNGL